MTVLTDLQAVATATSTLKSAAATALTSATEVADIDALTNTLQTANAIQEILAEEVATRALDQLTTQSL